MRQRVVHASLSPMTPASIRTMHMILSGAAGTAIVGMVVLGDSTAPLRIMCIVLILAGVIGLKLA
jgi:multidrug transporter EmrE-like cation transporter